MATSIDARGVRTQVGARGAASDFTLQARKTALGRTSGRPERDVLALFRMLALLALVAGTLAAQSLVPLAVFDLPCSAAVAAVSSVVGLALFQLGVLRFRALGRSPDLLVGVAFGFTAVAHLLIGAQLTALGFGARGLSLLSRALASAGIGIAVVQYEHLSSLVRCSCSADRLGLLNPGGALKMKSAGRGAPRWRDPAAWGR